MRAHRELEALGKEALDCFEQALRAESKQNAVGSFEPYLSQLLNYDEGSTFEPERVQENSNVTLSMLRYQRKGEHIKTSSTDSGEVNTAIQQKGTGLPCGAHTDASMITLIAAPSQLGLELFDCAHPMNQQAHARIVDGYTRARNADGKAESSPILDL